MDIHQLKTFVTVAREGSITRASELLHLSQPAVSAHIKAMEETLGVTLFERTPKGMTLTGDGQRLFAKAEQALAAHRELIDEASRLKGHLSGKLRLGIAGNASTDVLRRVLATLSARCPDVEVELRHGNSVELLDGLRSGTLDAGFYNEAGEPDAQLTTIEVARFAIHLAAAPALAASLATAPMPTAAPGPGAAAPPPSQPLDWKALAELAWIGPTAGSCCGRAAENLFERHRFRPRRMLHIDRESVTRTLIADGVGIGLLHEDTARSAEAAGEAVLLGEAQAAVRVLFAHRAIREQDPLLVALRSIVSEA